MSGLVLKLAPGERFIVNGAVVENGEKVSSVRIRDANARVLRCRDALLPGEVNSPVKQVYYAIQLLITGDITEDKVVPAILRECDGLEDVFLTINSEWVPVLRKMITCGSYYSALCHLRQMIAIETELLARQSNAAHSEVTAEVA